MKKNIDVLQNIHIIQCIAIKRLRQTCVFYTISKNFSKVNKLLNRKKNLKIRIRYTRFINGYQVFLEIALNFYVKTNNLSIGGRTTRNDDWPI